MKGSLETKTFNSPSLEGNPLGDPSRRHVLVYLPPGYAAAAERYPTVYFLHGFSGSLGSWTNHNAFQPSVPERLDNLIDQGNLPPCIGVFIDGWSSIGGSQWINSDAIGRYRDYTARDVVGFVDRNYRTVAKAAGRAVVGKSSGGYGALVMGRYHPEVFGHIGSHSGDSYFEYCYMPDLPKAAGLFLKAGGHDAWYREFVQRSRETKARGEDFTGINMLAMAAAYSPKKSEPMGIELPFEFNTAKLRVDVWSRWLVHDPVRFVPKYADAFRRLSSVFVDCGSRDEYHLRWGARLVVEELRNARVEVVHEEFEDGHTGINYRYDRSLSYLVPRMARD